MTVPIDLGSWRDSFQAALDESDPAKLVEKIHVAEEAIFLRSQVFDGSNDHHGERREMDQASEKLLSLKTEKLGWPLIK